MQIPEDVVDDVRKRLRRAAGPVQAVERMLSGGHESREVVVQISAATTARNRPGSRSSPPG